MITWHTFDTHVRINCYKLFQGIADSDAALLRHPIFHTVEQEMIREKQPERSTSWTGDKHTTVVY